MNHIKAILTTLFACLNFILSAQTDTLGAADAVRNVIENNYRVKLAENALSIAENNTKVYNTNQLPSIFMDGSANYSLDNTTANFQDGRSTTVTSAPSQGARLSMNVAYTIFDGFLRKHNIEDLKRRFELTDLQLEAALENSISLALTQYYQAALFQNNLVIMEDMIEVSRQRLDRANQLFEFGQSNKLAVLNAEVDLNNDSLNFYNAELQLDNARRALNNTMATDPEARYALSDSIETMVPLDRAELYEALVQNNTSLELIDKNIEIGQLQIKLAEARRLPQFDFTSRYDYSWNKNNPAAFLASQNSNGLFLGLTARWNIFDGGATKTAVDNARLNTRGLALEKASVQQDLELDFGNAWAQYENAQVIMRTASKNLSISRQNFERSQEQFNAGQLNSVDFRQAQLNLTRSRVELNNSKFELKISEIQLMLISGQLIDLQYIDNQ